MDSKLEDSNAALRSAVEARLSAKHDCEPKIVKVPKERPGSLAFMEILEEIRQTHIKKSQDYGDPLDALANIRSGAEFVGIEPWRGCLVRVADKMQRIKSYCRDGRLANEGFEDALLDLASYAIIALIMFREGK